MNNLEQNQPKTEEIQKELQRQKDKNDYRILMLTGIAFWFLGTMIPENTTLGKIAEDTSRCLALGCFGLAALKIFGVQIIDTTRKIIGKITKPKK